jgi:hypothetical protein
MPNPTDAQRHKLNRDPIRDPHIILLEFQEDGQAAINRAAINTEDVIWNGNTYYKSSIDIQLPVTGDNETRATMTASNIDRLLSRAIDSANQRINVRMILIDYAAPETAIIDTKNLLVIPSASGDANSVTADLGPRATLLEPVPSKKTTKLEFPGIWLA